MLDQDTHLKSIQKTTSGSKGLRREQLNDYDSNSMLSETYLDDISEFLYDNEN